MTPHPCGLVALVDDDKDLRELLQEVLERSGYQVKAIPNGLRLLSVLKVDRPSVILLDVMMSWINGVEVCRALKQNPLYHDIPVVMMSALARPEDVERGLEAGALDYFTKPFDLDRLLSRLRDVVCH